MNMSLTDDLSPPEFAEDVDTLQDRDFTRNDKPKDEKHRNCRICKGCQHVLERLDQEVTIFNSTYRHRDGYSSAWVYKTHVPCSSTRATNNTGEIFCNSEINT